MNFLELVKIRQSVRKYSNAPVSRDLLFRCIEAARLAPSASNSQPWTYIIIDEPAIKDKVARLTFNSVIPFNKFTLEAPVLVVLVIGKPKLITRTGAFIKKIEYPKIDIGISAAHFCLQAAEEGLGTCMIGWFSEKPIKKILNIPATRKIGLLISAGYAPDNYRIREKIRKPIDEIARVNSY